MKPIDPLPSSRNFIKISGLGAVALGLHQVGCTGGGNSDPEIQDLANVPD